MTEIPTEALEAAAWALADANREGWLFAGRYPTHEHDREKYRQRARTALAAAAPYLIAEGRRQGELHALKAAEEAILSEQRPDPILDTHGIVIAATAVRRLAARIAEGGG